MRKRAQRKGILAVEPKHIMPTVEIEKKPSYFKKNWWVAVTLIAIFLLVLFFNSYFNIASGVTINPEGTSLDKFYLSGPDPYYNMRLVNGTLETGKYPYYSTKDPLLNYPLSTTGGRPPFLNMMAISFSRILTPFMSEVDAVGYSMQFVPALFGALLVFPVYFIGEALFGKKAGLVAAFLIALIPAHISSGHGSAYSLFDHDSLNLLLFFLAFLFLIKGIKDKDPVRSVLYALLAGTAVAALTMVWVEAQFLYVIIAIYAIVQMLIDIFMNKMEIKVPIVALVALSSGYLISLPVTVAKASGFAPNVSLFLCLGIAAFSLVYFIFNRKKIPWTISLPTIFGVGIVALVFLYFINAISSVIPFFSSLSRLSTILYGSGIYGSKVSMTIAEASTYDISHTVMSFGPALYWLGWAGFLFLIYYYYKNKQRRDYLFIIVLFLIDIWLTGTAGRFINDMVPLIALLGGWVVWMVVDKIDYKQMVRNIRSAGGGFHGLRRGVKILHIFGVLFIAFLVILPNVYIAFDAAVPVNKKADVFGAGASEGAFGLSTGKEAYWVDAYGWLSKQDTNITDFTKRPAFISWWDYGFYEVALGAHPTVADNFQDGIPPAANFETATSEKEAVAVWIVRLLEGNLLDNNGLFSNSVIEALENHLGKNKTDNITKWMSGQSPSYNTPIGEEYNEELSKEWRVGQWYANAYYHDISKLLTDSLDDEGITWLYHDIQNATNYSIRYYGVEGYDKQIFNIFGFLADKSLLMVAGQSGNPEDDFEKIMFVGYRVDAEGNKVADGEWSYDELNNMSIDERKYIAITSTKPIYKDAYFDTMFYRTYIGPASGASGQKQEFSYQLPCIDMKHFYAEYISNYSRYAYYQGQSAVVIAKYYEGAYINGSVTFMNESLSVQVAVQKNIHHYGTSIPIDHDKVTTIGGKFNLIAPAGNITLQIRRNIELGENAFILKNVTFDSTTDQELFPISDAEAMRKSGTNYERIANISIDPANIEGYVYQNEDNNETYNASSDKPLSNVNITLYEINEFDTQTGNIKSVATVHTLTTTNNGRYNASDLMPGFYLIRATLDDFVIHENYLQIRSGNNSYNISKPKPATVEGRTYYDSNKNSNYDAGEELGNVNVEILYNTLEGNKKQVDKTVADGTGRYSFSSLIPGSYILNATKLSSATGYLDYNAEEEVTLNENTTTSHNISMTLAPVTVNGYTKYGDETIGGISIQLLPDGSVKNNTAVENSKSSNVTTGHYEINLVPGSYNISATQQVGQTTVYSYEGKLEVHMGEGTKTANIIMTKISATVSGNTKYEGKNVENITVKFRPDTAVENNTAKLSVDPRSDKNGFYEVELAPGSYSISVNETINEAGENVTYTFTDTLVIKDTDVIKTYEITLARKVKS
ncbi:MAG: glycosyltransferase family 39 protein [Euryarchaeota archaeon]|nr:glycosyltransferase family 39 protein [Euryarchaeota archaeon]